MTCTAPEFGAYLYRDAEPVEDPEFVRSMEAVQKEIQTLEQRLAASENMEPLERNSLSSQLEQKKKDFEAMAVSEQRYLISENDLNLYRTYGENLYFQPPSIFDPSTEERAEREAIAGQVLHRQFDHGTVHRSIGSTGVDS